MGPRGRNDPSTRRRPVTNPWKVVIIGVGFGGLSAAQVLKSDLVDVTLVDRRAYRGR